MNLKSFNGSARRRGTTIAAAALSVAMVAPFVHPIASPQTAAVAQAQESDAPASNANVIEADAIANGYIGSATDMTNAKSTLSGRAYIDDGSGFGPTDAGNLPVPEGTTVYMQWIDKDGAVSPVYSAKTSNQLSSDKTSQAGPGAYAFDLREPWTDVHGKDHTYTASAKQYYKLWINPFTDERNGATVVPFRQVGGFFPGAFMNSAGASQQGAWNTIGTNMQRTSVLMQNEGDTSYMHKPKAEWVKDTEETLPNQSGNFGMKNHVGGRVWLETRDVRVDGPDMTGSDVAAAGFNVVMSVLTPEGIGEYAAKVETLPLAQQQAAAKQLLEEHPEYIAETVTTKVGEDGYYSVKFSDGKLTNESKKYLYAHVESPDGKPMIGYSGWRLPLYQSPTANGGRNPNPIAAQNLVANPMWYNVNFALVPRHNVSLDITNYDMTEHPARVGDTPVLDVKGPFPVTPNKIVWKKNGKEFKTCEGITSEAEANKCVFVVPEDAVKGDVFTAEFVTGDDTVIAADSFVVTDKPYAEELEPKYEDTKVVPGKDAESIPSFVKEDEDGNPTEEKVDAPEGSKFSIPEDFKAPEGYTVKVDESTGVVTVTADPEKLNKDTVEEFDVPVTVEYPDGSTDDAKAKFELDTDGDGTPDSKDDDDDGDGVPDTEEIDKGTNPKDKNERPLTPIEPGEDTTAATVEPKYEDTKVVPGKDAESIPSFVKEDEDGNPTEEKVDAPEGSKFSIPEDFKAPEGYTVKVDESTGVVTVTADPEKLNKDTVEEFDVPVTVEYPDGSTDDAKAKFELDTDGDGTPDSKDDDDDGDGVPDTEEIDKGTNPKDKNERPLTPIEPGEDTTAATVEPKYNDGAGQPGTTAPVDAPTFTNKDGDKVIVPEGTKFATDKDGVEVAEDGSLKVQIPEDAKPGEKITVPVEVTYPDGSTDNVDVTVTVTDPDSTPEWGDGEGEPGDKVTVPNEGGDVPEGSTVEVEGPGKAEIDENGNLVVDIDEDAKPGEKVVVVVKGKDGNTIDDSTVTVTEPSAPAEQPDWKDGKGKPGDKVEIPNTGGPVEDGTTVETEGPNKAEIDKNGKLIVDIDENAKPGDKVVVVVKDKNGKQIDRVEVEVEQPDAPADKPDWKDGKGKPGDKVEIPNTGGPVEDGTTVETEGPNKAEIDKNGKLIVDIDENAKPGDKVVVVVKDKNGKEIDRVVVEVEKPSGSSDGSGSSDLSSKPNQRCINTGLGVGIPLLFLIPVGLASQMNIPGLSDFVAPINKQIRDLNTQLQKQAGVFNGPLAGKMAGIDAQLKRFGVDHQQAAGAVALIAAGALAIGLIADACAPGAGSSNGSSK